MRRVVWVLAVVCAAGARAEVAPVLQWVRTTGGSGTNQVTTAAADANGNLYIAGSTSSLDFPVTSAFQPRAGGSTLFRIDRVTGESEELYPAGLSALASIAVDPRNPQTVYATSGNSLWRSTDAGTTWTSLSTFPAGVAVRWVAVDPFDASTLYAATPRQGMFKSVDGGLTWTAANVGIPQASDGTINVGRVWADPKVPHVVFASFTSGLLRSGDGGASWSVVAGSFFFGATLAFDPLSAGTLYVALGMQISKSTDDGKTFTALGTLPDQVLPVALEADPFHAGVLYASTYDGIFQSSDAGPTWTLKAKGQSTVIAADPKYPNIYANITQYGIVRSSDGFGTSQPLGPPAMSLNQIAIGGQWVFVTAASSTDAFVVKLDSQGNTVYSTYFGGSANDATVAIAVVNDGSVYVAGTTSSVDFPVTAGAYATGKPGSYGSNFLCKLNPDGSLAWSTYFADSNTTMASVAVDAAGNPYIGGSTGGGLPTTPGAYQTQFQRGSFCTGFIGCFPGPSSAFVTKFRADGASLIYSTYVSTDSNKQTVQNAQALVFDGDGNVYLGGSGYPGSSGNVVLLNAAGSALLGSAFQMGVNISAIARDASGSVYATGSVTAGAPFPATAGAFQTGPRPPAPSLPAQAGAGGGSDAFVIKWDASLSHILAATLLGGELVDLGESIAIDPSGNVIVSGTTDSKAFPTVAPLQTAFSARTGFVSELDPSLSQLVFSTYIGDERPFDAHAAAPDGSGNILMAGSILGANQSFLAGDPGFSYSVANIVVANKIALAPAPAVRLDSVVNAASRLAAAVAPGEAIAVIGSGFGADSQLLLDGAPASIVSRSATELVAVMPDDAKTSGPMEVKISSGGVVSNTTLVPSAPASPGVFSADGSGVGQGYILNGDGTMNSPANPAAPGSAIIIFATGPGQYSVTGGYAVTALMPAVFIDGFYADGIGAIAGPVAGLPGNVYQISVYVPDPAKLVSANPNLVNFKMPPRVGVQLAFGSLNPLNPVSSAMISQQGLLLNVAQ